MNLRNPHCTPALDVSLSRSHSLSLKFYTIAATFVVATAFAGCSQDETSVEERAVTTDYRLQEATDCDGLREKLITIVSDYIIDVDYYERYGNDFDFANYADSMVGSIDGEAKTPNQHRPGVVDSNGNPIDSIDYTGTNNHEAAADEADSVKTDGHYTYIIDKDKLRIVQTWKPSEFQLLKTVDLKDYTRTFAQAFKNPDAAVDYLKSNVSGLESLTTSDKVERIRPIQLALDGDHLVIFAKVAQGFSDYDDYHHIEGEEYKKVPPPKYVERGPNEIFRPGSKYGYQGLDRGTRVIVLDVSNRKAPTVTNIVDISGYYRDARTISGSGTFSMNSIELGRTLRDQIFATDDADQDIREIVKPLMQPAYFKASKAEQKATQGRVRYKLHKYFKEHYTLDDFKKLLPQQLNWGRDLGSFDQKLLVQCDNIYTAGYDQQLDMLSVVHVPYQAEQKGAEAVGLIADFTTVYSTGSELFLAQPLYSRFQWWGGGDSTAIHKFDYPKDGSAKIVYKGSGKVDGSLKDQFSMSAYKGYLRLFTTFTNEPEPRDRLEDDRITTEPIGRFETTANLYILKEEDDELQIVSKLTDLSDNESVYSARFLGDRAFLVTFRRTDPLFTFDLSNPEKPQNKGILEVPGFSTYIHPLGENHLLTIGRNATNEGRVKGLHLQVFDVTDLATPQRTAHFDFGGDLYYSESEAEHSAHAFTFDPRTSVLSIPVYLERRSNHSQFFDGFQFFSIKPNEIRNIGAINHFSVFDNKYCNGGGGSNKELKLCHYPYSWGIDYRSIIITGNPEQYSWNEVGDKSYIYTLSRYGIYSQPLDDPSQVTGFSYDQAASN